jgi:hypothetical protein
MCVGVTVVIAKDGYAELPILQRLTRYAAKFLLVAELASGTSTGQRDAAAR